MYFYDTTVDAHDWFVLSWLPLPLETERRADLVRRAGTSST